MRKFKLFAFAVVAFAALTLTSCQPFQEEIYIDIKPNEAAFIVPQENGGVADQKQLKSLEFLKKNMISSQRFYIPTKWHKTGRWASDGVYIPMVKVVVVDRTPVTREWVKGALNGTSPKDEGMTVESSNSIAFTLGITCTASIPSETAYLYQFFYGGKKLSEVMDNNVRSFVLDQLTGEFGKYQLGPCQMKRTEVYASMKKNTNEFFASRGIRIDNLGVSGGWKYVNDEIQTAINLEFIAEKKDAAASKEVSAANKFMSAAEAIKAQKRLDAEINLTNSIAEGARTGKLPIPGTLVLGPGMTLMDVYAAKNLNK